MMRVVHREPIVASTQNRRPWTHRKTASQIQENGPCQARYQRPASQHPWSAIIAG
jgi:hypothetical protein